MRKFLFVYLFIILSMPVYSKDSEKLDVNSGSFMELGRYVETFETNEASEDESQKLKSDDDNFAEYSYDEIVRRYEENAVELKLEDNSHNALKEVNSSRIFKLRVNEDKFNIENNIRTENMIWDTSKTFTNAFLNNSRHLAPIPSVINSSQLIAKASNNVTANLGQTYLYDSLGTSALFIRANESTYNTGSVISYNGEGLKVALGSFSSSYNHASSGGLLLSSNDYKLPFNTGAVSVGGGYFANEDQEYYKSTGGGFIQYSFKRLKLSAQLGQSRYSNSNNVDTSFYFIPEYKLTDTLYLKTRFIRNVSQKVMQDELALSFRPKNNPNNLEFEINTSSQYTNNDNINRRIKFSTSFKI